MTTRSGRPYCEMSDEREARDGDMAANLVKVLLKDRQRREEEAARREQQLQQQMETLLTMVQTPGVREDPGQGTSRREATATRTTTNYHA